MSHQIDLHIDGVHYSSKALDGVSIQWGRQSVQDQPEPTSCTFSLLRDSTLGTIDVADIKIGAEVKLEVAPPSQPTFRRFFGVVTDVDVNHETVVVACVATGIYVMRQLGWVLNSGQVDSSEGDASSVVIRFYNYAAQQLGFTFTNPPAETRFPQYSLDADWPNGHPYMSFVNGVAADEPPVRLGVLDTMVEWAKVVPSGVIWENMLEVGGVDNVNVVFDGQLARDKPLTPDLVLTADEVLLDWTSGRDLGLFTTSSNIGYSGFATVVGTDVQYNSGGTEEYVSALTAGYGAFAKSYGTKLVYAADAAELAKVNVQNGQVPGYVTLVTVPMKTLAHARQSAIVAELLVGNLIEIPSLSTGLPTVYFLEGYAETISQGDWTIRLMLSDPSNSWYGQRWQDVTPTLKWNQVDHTVTWIDLQGMEL